MAKLSTADAEMRSQRLLNTAVRLSPKPRAETIEAMRAIRRAIRSGPGGFRESVALLVDQVLPSAHYVLTSVLPLAVRQRRLRPFIRYGWSEIPPELAKFVGFELELQIELAPRPENRVTLATDRDSWGRAAAEVRWRWSDLDLSSLRETERMIASELENSGLGRVQPCEPDRWPNIVSASGAHHHMGTTRMHMDPKQGVVDADCRAHGVENLYLAGSSVFPTGGYANPTLTIIALSIRLADRIAKLARDTPAPVALPTDSSAPRGPIAST